MTNAEGLPRADRGSGHVFFVGPLPPPLHGMSTVNAAMLEALRRVTRVTVTDLSPRVGPDVTLKRGLKYHLSKSSRALGGLARILPARLGGARCLYASVDDGLGGVWILSFCALARLLGMRITLHHHSYRYLTGRTRLMAMITAVAGRDAVHVTLGADMAARLRRLYPSAANAIVVGNAVPQVRLSEPSRHDGVVIGMLSNMMFDKGIDTFVDVALTARARGVPVRAVLAGPATDDDVRGFLLSACAAYPDVLTWLGPVSGAAKRAFFDAIDLFVFPTRYRTEALPLVLIEALVHGKPFIAPDRGSIGSLRTDAATQVIPLEQDFTMRAVDWIGTLGADAEKLASLGRAATIAGAAINERAEAAQRALVLDIARWSVG